ncbi:MAG: prolyl oligopeptidase family serine peptidase [Planctomycetota bacterium]
MRVFVAFGLSLLALGHFLTADKLVAQQYKQLPPPGIAIKSEIRAALQARIETLRNQQRQHRFRHPKQAAWMTDVDALIRAVELALQRDNFYKPVQPKQAETLLNEAGRRISQLAAFADRLTAKDRLIWMGWDPEGTDRVQLIVGGYRSNIDDSVQPFGLVLPKGFRPEGQSYRLDVWLHGRGDTKTEVPFLIERLTKPGQYTPSNTVVLHPFGRHCNAFKFAGEVDVYESMQHVTDQLSIDRDRVSIRGFSMGGAGCWHLAVHDPAAWFAANPGAGFVDTLVYQGWDKKPLPFPMDDVSKKLLHWYDVLPWVENLDNTRVVAYSGEVDKQKQAADRVMKVAQDAGLSLHYVIGSKMGHKIDAVSMELISKTIDQWSADLAQKPRPSIKLVTYTLRYPQVGWLKVDGMVEHWTRATVSGQLAGDDQVKIRTEGVTHLTLDFSDSGHFESMPLKVDIDGDRLLIPDQTKGGGYFARLIRADDGWYGLESPDQKLRKRPGLQGPIDDAFCDRFLFVLPSRPAKHGVVQRWISKELDYARARWKSLMRGDVRAVLDSELTDEQIQNNHLICFGDYQSNRFLTKIQKQLPIEWTSDAIKLGDKTFDPSTHAPVMCYPNPLNRDRYVVINSGMTFREFSNVSNSRQIAMLPDWAIIDVSQSGKGIFPGDVAAEGFFDEQWRLKD